MPALVAGIHVFLSCSSRTWMAGTSPAMTNTRCLRSCAFGPRARTVMLRGSLQVRLAPQDDRSKKESPAPRGDRARPFSRARCGPPDNPFKQDLNLLHLLDH